MIYKSDIKKSMKEKIINSDDIDTLLSLSYNEFLNILKTSKTYKQKLLVQIYLKPSLLYDINFLTEDNTSSLIEFVIRRYKLEETEMKNRYEYGSIDEKEYDTYIKKLNLFFFPEDSFMGKNIKRIMESKKCKVLQR